MTAMNAEEPRSDDWQVIVAILIIAVFVVGIIIFLNIPSPTDRVLQQCDQAIKATLKAPTTFKRISELDLSGGGGPRLYMITYDAENSFAVPLRSTGTCKVQNGAATWSESGE